MDNRPIGVFDSGIGGLTVLKSLIEGLPGEGFVYFGDCARVPYGTKSKDTVVKYTYQDLRLLMSENVKLIVIACFTASARFIEEETKKYNIPVVEVITPGAAAGAAATKINRIGVICTQGTMESGVYNKAVLAINPDINIVTAPCPLFVPLVEEGWWDNDIAYAVAHKYLDDLKGKDIDNLILGCTHYSLLAGVIQKIMGESVKLISPGKAVTDVVAKYLNDNDMFRDDGSVQGIKHDNGGSKGKGRATNNGSDNNISFYTSDSVEKFKMLSSAFLGRATPDVKKIEIEDY